MPKKSKYLVCVSEKEHSKVALLFACTKAAVTGGIVEMLYVIDPVDYNTIFSVADVIKEDRKAHAEDLLKNLSKEMKKLTDTAPRGVIREGKIADVIVSHIEEDTDMSLLFIGVASDGSTGKGGLLTQLTNEIGDKFHIPMMFVPGNLTEEEIKKLNG